MTVLLTVLTLTAGDVTVVRLTPETYDLYAPGGKEVDAIHGDIVLTNGRITAVIANPIDGRDANLTCVRVGGCLIDLVPLGRGLESGADTQSDQLTVFRPGGPRAEYRGAEARVAVDSEWLEWDTLEDGIGGVSTAEVRVGPADGEHAIYRLSADADWLEVEATGRVDALRIDRTSPMMSSSPDGQTTWAWVECPYWGRSYGVAAGSPEEPASFDVDRERRAMLFRHPESDRPVVRRITVDQPAKHGVSRLGTRSALFPDGRVTQVVLGGVGGPTGNGTGGFLAGWDVKVLARGERDEREIARVYTRTGQSVVRVPHSEGAVRAWGTYMNLAPGLPKTMDGSGESKVVVTMGPREGFGSIKLRVEDEGGWPMPGKVAFFALGRDDVSGEDAEWTGGKNVNFGPDSAIHGVRNLQYIGVDPIEVTLPPGDYRLLASRGPEYHSVERTITVRAGEFGRVVTMTVPRAFDTPGWISTDFHSHSTPSGDNTSHQRGRVLNLACEDIDYAPCTEHQRIDSYRPHIESLRLTSYIGSCPGMELTGRDLPINHHNVFPLVMKPREQSGGGPRTGADPDEQVERLALWDDRSEKVIQQDHPDIGWLHYDKDGDGERDEGFSRAVGLLDCMEIHPVEHALRLFPDARPAREAVNQAFRRNQIIHWLQILNQGRRITGVINTDAHWNFHGSGWTRNWIRVPDDDPRSVEVLDLVHATEGGHVVMSNGPMLEFTLLNTDGKRAEVGEDLAAPDGEVQANVRVRCPNWLDVDRVGIVVNGRMVKSFRRGEDDGFRDETDGKRDFVRFERTVPLELAKDSLVLAVAGSETHTLGAVFGPEEGQQRAAAITNPVWVDVDGNGFAGNEDTLDVPLPTKFRR